jgi:hypothetical protein
MREEPSAGPYHMPLCPTVPHGWGCFLNHRSQKKWVEANGKTNYEINQSEFTWRKPNYAHGYT